MLISKNYFYFLTLPPAQPQPQPQFQQVKQNKECWQLKLVLQKQGEAIGCVRDDTQGTVTKDEEEVAEALYALSGVFSSAVKTDKRRFTGQGIGTKAEDSVTPLDGLAPSFV